MERWKKVKRENVEWDNDKKGRIIYRKEERIEWENWNKVWEKKYINNKWEVEI